MSRWNSYNGWGEQGYYVLSNEKSALKCPLTNEQLYHEDQVMSKEEDDVTYWEFYDQQIKKMEL